MRRPTDVFSGYDANGTTTFDATATTIPITTEHIASSPTYSLANGELTVEDEDRYEITFALSAMVGSSARTQAQGWLELNGVEVAGTRVLLYCRLTNHGATGSSQVYLDLQAGDVLRIRGQRTAGSGILTGQVNGTRLTLRRL